MTRGVVLASLLVAALAASAIAAKLPDAFLEGGDDLSDVYLEDWEEPTGHFERIEIEHAGYDRLYVLYTPADVPSNASLVLLPHFAMGSPLMAELFARMASTADRFGYVVAYPRGLNRTFYAGPMCCGQEPERDDINLMRKIVTDVATRRDINLRRVYSAGLSNGGYMSYALACQASDVFAAVAPVAAASPWASFDDNCSPLRPVPVLAFHGTNDRLVDYDFGVNVFLGMAAANGCDINAKEISYQAGVTTCESFTQCGTPGFNMTLCTAEGAGHRYWPGSPSLMTFPQNHDIQASEQMLTFFNKYQIE